MCIRTVFISAGEEWVVGEREIHNGACVLSQFPFFCDLCQWRFECWRPVGLPAQKVRCQVCLGVNVLYADEVPDSSLRVVAQRLWDFCRAVCLIELLELGHALTPSVAICVYVFPNFSVVFKTLVPSPFPPQSSHTLGTLLLPSRHPRPWPAVHISQHLLPLFIS